MPASRPTVREGAGAPPAADPFEPKAGMLVADKYRVERVIGEGGMGIVAAATHVELDQRVAIKFLSAEAMRSSEATERFLREAKVAARVKSEHVARVSDVGRVEPSGVPFIVMEYLEGSDLGALIAAEGKLPVDEVCEIGLQACEALAEVHAGGIVHRDLKPSNLFVTRKADGSPCVKLLDFGISKFAAHPGDEGVDPALTATATIMGSPSYMSPEQLRSTKEVDARTDVWSLGAVLYEAVTGRPAFRGETVPQVCFMIGSEEPAPPSSLRAEIPPELERIVLACLDKKVETRATLVDLARVLVIYAPERARASLDRVEVVLGTAPPRIRDISRPVVPRVLPPPEHARTQASWQDDERERRGRRKRGGGWALLLLVMVTAGVLGFGVYTGRIDVGALRGQVSGATGEIGSAIASATAAMAPSTPPSAPSASAATVRSPAASTPAPSSPSAPSAPSAAALAPSAATPAASASAEADDDAGSDEDDDDDAPDAGLAIVVVPSVPAPVRVGVPPAAVAPHPVQQPVRRKPATKHHVHKTPHKHH